MEEFELMFLSEELMYHLRISWELDLASEEHLLFGHELAEILAWCKKNGNPAVFWESY